MSEVLRYTAFSTDPAGGNPAGVVLDAEGIDAAAMQEIAAKVGYSETAFVFPEADGVRAIRYFSPAAEVPFCGHATIATAVAVAERSDAAELHLATPAGRVDVVMERGPGGIRATLTSVGARVEPVADADVAEALTALGWTRGELDPELPPRVAFAGGRHLVLAAATRERLAGLDYDFARLRALCLARDWGTVHLVWPESPTVHHARDPFPAGGVVEDPATGAAAAAYGGYLRELGRLAPGTTLTVRQGEDLGRPSLLYVSLVPGSDRVRVTGHAVPLAART